MATIQCLIIGDIIGQTGMRSIFQHLPLLIKKHNAQCVIINGENANEGFGITLEQVRALFKIGVHVITSGNHIWHTPDIAKILDTYPNLLRPLNYPKAAGNGIYTFPIHNTPITVINVQGRHAMTPIIDCPFTAITHALKKIPKQNIIIIDMHAELVMEKEALAYYCDGRVSLVYGTHTHVQTMDERITQNGTAYISDIGATGSNTGVIGFDPSISLSRIRTQLPMKNNVYEDTIVIHGIVVHIDTATQKAKHIIRIQHHA